jgi:hypothetical protein
MSLLVGLPAIGLALLASGGADAFGGIEPWRTLPQTLRGTQHVPLRAGETGQAPADTLKALYPALAACWQVPEGLSRFERAEITARLSLRRDGSVIGTPQVTFAKTPGDAKTRDILIRATLHAGPAHPGPRRSHRGAPPGAALHLRRTQRTRNLSHGRDERDHRPGDH